METKEKAKRKPRRKLSEIDFSGEGAHIALTSKTVNSGPANGADYALVIKGRNFSDEFIEKMQQVRVTMELPDFISKFFNIWEGDAKVLAHMMGYVEEAETQTEENMEAESEYQDWIKSRMEAFEILKSMQEQPIAEVLSSVSEDDYLAVLRDQETIEKAFAKAETESKSVDDKDDTSSIGTEVKDEGNTSVSKQANKENLMQKEDTPAVEMVEKSVVEAVQKALAEQKEQLEKAQAIIAQFEAEKKEAVVKAKTAQLKEVVEDKHLEVVVKAALSLEDADFESFVSAMADLKATVEKSALFQEQGASGESQEVIKESGVAKILKAKLK